MGKDPAALFYIDTWLSSTAEMDSDVRGWYLNLILHNYDKKSLPNDIEKLAVLSGVKFSEFERFKQMYKQVLEQKFNQNEDGRLINPTAMKILKSREDFKDKRSKSGNIGVIIKIAKSIEGFTDAYLHRLKTDLYSLDIESIENHKDKQMLKQMLKLYINENEDINKDDNEDIKNKKFDFKDSMIKYGFELDLIDEWIEIRKRKKAINSKKAFNDFIVEVEKIKKDKNEILAFITDGSRQWRGFKASWFEEALKVNTEINKHQRNFETSVQTNLN